MAGGTYRGAGGAPIPVLPDSEEVVVEMAEGVNLFGGFAGTESLRDERDWKVNASIIDGEFLRCGVFGANNATLDGFIIQHAEVNGGMYNQNASPTVTNCLFRYNSAHGGGGMYNTGSDPRIENCIFSQNKAIYGGGLLNTDSSPTVINCSFANNTVLDVAGGVYNMWGSTPVIKNCIFSANSALNKGGGMANVRNSSPVLVNCTFTGNTTQGDDGAVMANSSESVPALTNCIIWGNSSGFILDEVDDPVVTYSCVEGGYAGEGNIDTDPLLTVMGCLMPDSPCINTGSSAVSGLPAVDLRGNDRVQDGRIDMGACEYMPGMEVVEAVLSLGPDEVLAESPKYQLGAGLLNTSWFESGETLSIYPGEYSIDFVSFLDWENPQVTTISISASENYGPYLYTSMPGKHRYYVDADATGSETGQSWEDAFTYIQPAIDAASVYGVGEIWVAEGTYFREPVVLDYIHSSGQVVKMRDRIALYGGFVGTETSRVQRNSTDHPTIIDGYFEWFSDCWQVNSGIVGANNTILDGFTITGSSGGMINIGVSPTIRNCIFRGNWAGSEDGGSGGGGMYIKEASPMITNCQFIDNGANSGGGMYLDDASPVIVGCEFTGNRVNNHDGGGLLIRGGSPKITDCVFKENSAHFTMKKSEIVSNDKYEMYLAHGAGIYIDAASPTIVNCLFYGNEADEGGALCDSGETFMANCTFFGNSGWNGDSVLLTRFSSAAIQNCIFWGSDNEISNESEEGATVTYSCIEGGFPGEGNIESDPLFVAPHYGDLRLYAGSLCIDSGTTENAPPTDIRGFPRPYGAGVDMGAYEDDAGTAPEPVYLVDGDAPDGGDGLTWATAYNSIQDAVDAAFHGGGGVVWVAGGTYTKTYDNPDETPTQVVEMKEGVDLYGGFVGDETSLSERSWADNPTVIDATYEGNHFWTGQRGIAGADHAILDGFTVTNAFSGRGGGGMVNIGVSPTVENCIFYNNDLSDDMNVLAGAGVFNQNSSPVFLNCVFRRNATFMGPGGGMYNDNSSPLLTDCLFEENRAGSSSGGAIYNNSQSDAVLKNCEFVGNIAEYCGGAIYNMTSRPSITNCRFTVNVSATIPGNNTGGGAIYNNESAPSIKDCFFTGNTAGAAYNPLFEEDAMYCGGAIYNRTSYNSYSSYPRIYNCVFESNIAGCFGGAIYHHSEKTRITNCTFVENEAHSGGGVFLNSENSYDFQVVNSIIWGGSGGAVGVKVPRTIAIVYSCVEGGYDGEGNIDSDPMFVDLEHGNLMLSVGSPCIDSGTNEFSLSTDILGYPRPHGLGYDMGAYEYYGNRPVVAPLLMILGEGLQDGDGDLNNDGFIDAADLVVTD